MNPITDEQRDQAYKTANPTVRFLYGSPQSGAQLKEMALRHGVPEEKYRDFAIMIGDVILGLQAQTDLPRLLGEILGIGVKQSLAITGDLIDFLSQEVPAEALEKAIAETEEALASVPTVRTMEDDMQANTVATSSQDDLLSATPPPPPATPPSAPQTPDTLTNPRWESERE